MRPTAALVIFLNLFLISNTALSRTKIVPAPDTGNSPRPIELSLLTAGEFTMPNSAPARIFLPTGLIGIRAGRFQFGFSGAIQGIKTVKGRLSLFGNYQLQPTTSNKKTSLVTSLEAGYAIESRDETRFRLGLGLGWLKFIGPEETPGIIRFNLVPIFDFWDGKIRPGLTISASVGVLIG